MIIHGMITVGVQMYPLTILTTFLYMDVLIAVMNNLYDLDEESDLPSSRSRRDITGVMLRAMSLSGTIFSVVVWNGLVVTKMDTFYLNFRAMGWSKQDLAKPGMIFLRHVLALLYIQMAIAALRTFILLLLSVDIWLAKLIKSKKTTVQYNNVFGLAASVKLYRQLQIVVQAMWNFGVFVGEGGLSFSFIIIVCGVGATFVGFLEGNVMLYFLSILATFASYVILQLIFSTLCGVFENSQVIVDSCRERAARIKDSGYTKRIFRSFHALALPAGNMGIMDRKIKVNFHDGLLNWILTILMVFSDMMSNQRSTDLKF